MDIDNFSKLKLLFSTTKDDMRSIFFLLAVSNMINLNCDCLYKLPYMIDMEKNDEWITYCNDINQSNIFVNVSEFIDCLNSWEIELIKKLCRVESYGRDITDHPTKIILDRTKFTEFSHIKYNPNHINSNNKQFEFNEQILNNFLKSIMADIPSLKNISINTISPIKKCFKTNDVNTYFDTIKKCVDGKNIDDCMNFMKSSDYNQKILDEVASMDICDAAIILVKFGFKTNNNISFESYNSWETRIKSIISVNSINLQLKKYIELLLERVNPIMILKKELQKNSSSIKSILNQYISPNSNHYNLVPKYNKVEENYHKARHIITVYSMLMTVFTNRKIFNYDNMYKYRNLYEKLNYKYLLQQTLLLNHVEENLLNQIKIN
jgi:hypothetical protein